MTQDPIDTLVNQAPDALPPGRDLWPGIERRLDDVPAARNQSALGRVAGWVLALVLGAGLGAGGQAWWDNQAQHQVGVQMVELMAAQHQQHLAQRQPHSWLQANAEAPKPESEDLNTLRQAGQELLQALKQDPFNPALLELWLWVQQRELELLNAPSQHPLQPL